MVTNLKSYMQSVTQKLKRVDDLKKEAADLSKEIKSDLRGFRKKLPDDWRDRLKGEFPELNTFDAGARVNDVLNGRSMDETLISALESICAKPKVDGQAQQQVQTNQTEIPQ